METSENVVYETVKPRYTVEQLLSSFWDSEGWEPDRGFQSLTAAQTYADDQQLIFPDAKFRVVDNEA